MDVPVQKTVEVAQVQKVQRTVGVPRKVLDIPVQKTGEAPHVQETQKTVGVPQIQCIDGVVNVPAQWTVGVPQDQNGSEIPSNGCSSSRWS